MAAAHATRSYATPLALTYGISLGIEALPWGAIAVRPSITNNNYFAATFEAVFYGLPLTWVAPGVVHAVNGEPWRGLGAVGGSAGCFALGLLVGFPVAFLTAAATADEAHPWGATAAYSVWAAFGLAGQAIWAVHDVNQNSSVAVDPAQASASRPAPVFQLAGVSIRPRGGGAVLEVDALF